MSEAAYGKRNIKAIQRKRWKFLLLQTVRKYLKKLLGSDQQPVKVIQLHPVVETKEILADLLNRVVWGFPPKKDLFVYVPVAPHLLNTDLSTLPVPSAQRNYLSAEAGQHVRLILRAQPSPDLLLLHEARRLFSWTVLRQLHRLYIIDQNYYSSTESKTWRDGYYDTLSVEEKNHTQELSQQNFAQLQQRCQDKNKAYCFVTGPSFDQYPSFDFEQNSIKIICNSVVKNQDFLQYIGQPDVLTFADPVFHFSPCEYAATFRDMAFRCLEQYPDCFLAVPLRTVPLLLHYAPWLENRIVGMDWKFTLHFPTPEALWVKGVDNILTYMMLPIASSLANDVVVMGADGRKPDENYFWKHSSSAQLGDLMQTVFDTHPSFFRDRVYTDYYEQHCAFLEEIMQFGEAKGKHYSSLTASYIPAFQKRPAHV